MPLMADLLHQQRIVELNAAFVKYHVAHIGAVIVCLERMIVPKICI